MIDYLHDRLRFHRRQRLRIVRWLAILARRLNRSSVEAETLRDIWHERRMCARFSLAATNDFLASKEGNIKRQNDHGQRQLYLACEVAVASLVKRCGSKDSPFAFAGPEREILIRLGDGVRLLEEASDLNPHWSMTYVRIAPIDLGDNMIRKLPAKRLAFVLFHEEDLSLVDRSIEVWMARKDLDVDEINELLNFLRPVINSMTATRLALLQKFDVHGFGDRLLDVIRQRAHA